MAQHHFVDTAQTQVNRTLSWAPIAIPDSLFHVRETNAQSRHAPAITANTAALRWLHPHAAMW